MVISSVDGGGCAVVAGLGKSVVVARTADDDDNDNGDD